MVSTIWQGGAEQDFVTILTAGKDTAGSINGPSLWVNTNATQHTAFRIPCAVTMAARIGKQHCAGCRARTAAALNMQGPVLQETPGQRRMHDFL